VSAPLVRFFASRSLGRVMAAELRSLLVALGLGASLAFAGSVPMTGPLALLVLDRIIALQRRAALWIALAGALVEGSIAAIVATLLPLVLRHSEAIVLAARLAGAIVIFAIGVILILRPELLESIKTDRKRESFTAGFLTTALNPTLLATWTVAVTALHANGLLDGGPWMGLAFGVGVALGALAWFLLLLVLVRRSLLARLQGRRVEFARIVGLVLTLLGFGLFWRAV
jgi:threonine/homoserine/homoserine lactone efflux protein